MDSIDKSWQGQFLLQLGLDEKSVSSSLEPLYLLIDETLNAPARYSFIVRGLATDIERLIRGLNQDGTPDLKIRLGVKQQGKVVWQSWQEHVVLSFSATPLGIGKAEAELRLDSMDRLWKLRRQTKTKARRGTVSQLVDTIAVENGFTQRVIEPTRERGTWVQYSSDLEFVVERLIPRASSATGAGNYRLYVRDNVLHFHSPDYMPVLRKFDYTRSGRGVSIVFSDESQQLLTMGVGGVDVYTHDPYSGKSGVERATPESTLKYGKFSPDLRQFSHTFYTSYHPSAANLEIPESRLIAQHLYDCAHSQVYTLVVSTSRTLNLKVNDMLRIDVNHTDSHRSSWSGWWTVTAVKHLVESGTVNSTFVLKRGELDSNLDRGQREAPGRPLRLAPSALDLTLDADRVAVEVLDPNLSPR